MAANGAIVHGDDDRIGEVSISAHKKTCAISVLRNNSVSNPLLVHAQALTKKNDNCHDFSDRCGQQQQGGFTLKLGQKALSFWRLQSTSRVGHDSS
jgi:flagellar basal body P-ring protein FlgI